MTGIHSVFDALRAGISPCIVEYMRKMREHHVRGVCVNVANGVGMMNNEHLKKYNICSKIGYLRYGLNFR